MPTTKPLHILILGGTGFIGAQQVGYALARGHKVTLFNRGSRADMWPPEVEQLIGDRERGDYAALSGRSFDVCIDNKSSVPHWVRDAADALGDRVDHYLLVSTLSVYASNATPGHDETAARQTDFDGDPFAISAADLRGNMAIYGAMKTRCEDEVIARYPDLATLVRPGLIVGPGDETDRFTYWPARIAQGSDVLCPPADDPLMFIDVRDLAEWTIRIVEARTFGIFNAVGPHDVLTVGELMNAIAAVTKNPVRFVHATREFLAEQEVSHWSDLPVWIDGRGDTRGFHYRSNARAIAAGLTFRPLTLTVQDTLAWWRAQPSVRTTQMLAGLKPEREAQLLRILSEDA
jgi:2'-hydroxyisoflavone reductase